MLGLILLGGCDESGNMIDQPRVDAYEPSRFFADGDSARPYVEGTVPRVENRQRSAFSAARPSRPPVTMALLARGQERFNVFCSVCHGRDGYGEGMIVQRGFPAAASYHTPRLRDLADEHIYEVITNGFENMPSYAHLVPPSDRWAIVAYIRALQLSQNAVVEDVPAETRPALDGGEGRP